MHQVVTQRVTAIELINDQMQKHWIESRYSKVDVEACSISRCTDNLNLLVRQLLVVRIEGSPVTLHPTEDGN